MVTMSGNQHGGNGKPPQSPSDDNVAEITDAIEQDFEDLNNRLDELNTALDVLEQQNDNIQTLLLDLLKKSREDRAAAAASPDSGLENSGDEM